MYRELQENVVFEKANSLQVFIWALLRANYKARTVRFGGDFVTLEAGQFISGRYAGAKACHMKPSTFRNQIHFLRKAHILDSRSDNKKTLFTVVNWMRYQSGDSEEDSKKDNKRTARGHRQEVKKSRKKSDSEERAVEPIEETSLAESIYKHYAGLVRSGARADAIRRIGKLLKNGLTVEMLLACIQRYAGNGMPEETRYRIQANNFFGMKERYKDYLGLTEGKGTPKEHLSAFVRAQIAEERDRGRES